MKAPGTAYNDPVLSKDPQPDSMSGYVNTTDDKGGVHINSGIPNRAFYAMFIEIGGYAYASTSARCGIPDGRLANVWPGSLTWPASPFNLQTDSRDARSVSPLIWITCPPDQATTLNGLLAKADFFNLPADSAKRCVPDGFNYAVTVETDQQSHTVRTSDQPRPIHCVPCSMICLCAHAPNTHENIYLSSE